ncbi:hypothetical protein [Halorussus halobius]|uniref:hypothetical protein n=1 Tax=Halorussus halobius TaxID=1710537 RepID=UPI0010922CAD|nr:hypothetical protein [Halorussus halobius]
MARKYRTFVETEIADEQYVVAKPIDPSDESVLLATDWFDADDPVEPRWGEPVRAMLRPDLAGGTDGSGDVGTVARERAVARLVEADGDGREFAASEVEAEALLDFLAANDVVALDRDSVVLLRDPDGASREVVVTWAIALDACVDQIDAMLDRLDRADATRRQGEDFDYESVVEPAMATYEEFAAHVTATVGVASPESTDSGDLQVVADEGTPVETADSTAETADSTAETADSAAEADVGLLVDRFEDVRETVVRQRDELRQLALGRAMSPGVAENLTSLVEALSGTDDVPAVDGERASAEETSAGDDDSR